MATATTSTVIDHLTNASFRTWVTEFISLLTTGGALVQLADGSGSGQGGTQINLATVALGAANQDHGYAVFRFDDSLQSTAPYFFRFGFGTGASAGVPRVRVTVGTICVDGVIGGELLAATIINRLANPTNVATPVNSWACGNAGQINLAWKAGGADVGYLLFCAYRIRDHSGAQTADGLSLVVTTSDANATAVKRCFRRVSAATFGPSQWGCLVPMEVASSVTSGGDRQCFRHFSVIPEARPDLELLTLVASEAGSAGTVFPARPTGGVDRNYVVIGTTVARGGLVAGASATSATYVLAFLYD